jgi:periplasmic divalent cation tolerance protein
MTDKIIVLTSCESEDHAARLARQLVELRLAACVNLLPQVRSVYRWKGEIEDAAEWMLVIKSRRDLFDSLRVEIEKMHSYEVPEIIAFPIVDGSIGYLGWLDDELAKAAE